MAKPTKPETALAVAEPQTTALAEYDDLIQDAGAGTEHISAEDVRPPRLMLSQSGSPQLKSANPKYNKELRDGQYFNSLSGEIYGDSVAVVVIKKLPSTFMQFDRNEVGKVIDYNVPADDPRTQFTTDASGKRQRPIATRFDNYLVLLPDSGEVESLSFKSTALTSARDLDSFIKYPLKIDGRLLTNVPAWARTFRLTVAPKSGNGNTWNIPKVNQAGITPPELRAVAKSLFDQYAKLQVVVEHDEADAATNDRPDPDDIAF